ncbi:MAG TPA: 16S rRNA (cytidine(1402)-2'-O)-methyltransferase [Nitrospiraceae bacterium]|nr:16S rRNA (cytidine(1402)-2'-O)-methyltransferase [Nitrospiraceae bacterium]
MRGTLYIVSTPIGNDEDISRRAMHILTTVSLVAAEDPRSTKALLDRYGIETPVTSYHAPDLEEKVGVLISRLQEGKHIAMVCEAGTPVITDPGSRLVEQAIAAEIPVVPIPGVCAAIAAIPASGLRDGPFFFQGVLPRAVSARRRLLHTLHRQPGTLVFFESPRRVVATLRDIASVFGKRRVVIAEDLTKPQERFVRGSVDHVLQAMALRPPAGEITLLIEGAETQRRRARKHRGRLKRR